MFHSFFELMLKFCFLSQPPSHTALMKLIIQIKELNEKIIISSFFSILFFKQTCFQEDQCPDPSVSSTTVRDTWCGAEEKAEYGFSNGNWSLGCPALTVYQHKRYLDPQAALRKPGQSGRGTLESTCAMRVWKSPWSHGEDKPVVRCSVLLKLKH